MLTTNGLHHLALRVTNLQRSKEFYTEIFGMQPLLEVEGLALLSGNGLMLGLRSTAEAGSGDRFDPSRVGLDHLAVAATDIAALEQMQRQLDGAGVPNNGVEHDDLTGATSVSFYDPDGIAWELYVLTTAG
jgi:glyoxylase I family protein